MGKRKRLVHGGEFTPQRLINSKPIQQSGKFIAIFSPIDVSGGCAQDWNSGLFQSHGQIIRNLAADGNDGSRQTQLAKNFNNGFQRNFVKYQHIRLVVVGAHGFRIVIEHHGLVA